MKALNFSNEIHIPKVSFLNRECTNQNANNNHWLNYQFRHTNVSFLIIKRLKIKMRNILFLVIVSFEVSNLSEIGSSSFQRIYNF